MEVGGAEMLMPKLGLLEEGTDEVEGRGEARTGREGLSECSDGVGEAP